jgi:hypothetical protein
MITTKRSMTDNVLEPRDGPPLPPNGEIKGPHDHVGQATRAHNLFPRPRRQADHASRTPPTIVGGDMAACAEDCLRDHENCRCRNYRTHNHRHRPKRRARGE